MKRLLIHIFTILLVVLGCENAIAYDFTVDGIYYAITDFGNLTCKVVKVNNKDYAGDIVIPAEVEYLNKKLRITEIGNAFSLNSKLTSINLPKGIALENGCFNSCSMLEKIVLPDDLKTIPAHSFENCTNLKNIRIPGTVTEIQDYAFYNCRNISNMEFPDILANINSNAFYGCSGIQKIKLPKSVIFIGEKAFANCKSITNVSIANNATVLSEAAFANDSNLVNANIPSKVRMLPDKIFANCSSLKSIEFPERLKSIGKSAFYGCQNLENIKFNEQLSAIADSAFKNCTKITAVTLPEFLDSIGDYAFHGTMIDSLYIPDAVAHISALSLRINALKKLSVGKSLNMLPVNADFFSRHEYGYEHYCKATISDIYRTIHFNDVAYGLTLSDDSGLYIRKWGIGYADDGSEQSLMDHSTNLSNITQLIIRDGNNSFNLNCGYIENLLLNIQDLNYFYLGRDSYNSPSLSINNKVSRKNAIDWNTSSFPYDSINQVPRINVMKLGGNCKSLPKILCYMDTLIVGSNVEDLTFNAYQNKGRDFVFNQIEGIKYLKLLGSIPPKLSGKFTTEHYTKLNVTVPENCLEIYQADPEWKKFWSLQEGSYPATSSVPEDYLEEPQKHEITRFNINGMPVEEHYKGIVITRYSDGSTQKTLIK